MVQTLSIGLSGRGFAVCEQLMCIAIGMELQRDERALEPSDRTNSVI